MLCIFKCSLRVVGVLIFFTQCHHMMYGAFVCFILLFFKLDTIGLFDSCFFPTCLRSFANFFLFVILHQRAYYSKSLHSPLFVVFSIA